MNILRRNRRLRVNETIRALVRETTVTPNDFIVPLFVVEGKGVKEEIPSMPDYYRYSLDILAKEVKELWDLGIKSVLLFVKVPDNLKDNQGTEALNPDGLMQRAIKTVKDATPQMLVMTDVALDPYSIYGHDGIIKNGVVENDATVSVLAQMSLSHVKAGADWVAPSDMMDGRIEEIRLFLDKYNFKHAGIMAYSALKEAVMDVAEGADMVMVKPGIVYLDIVREVKNAVQVPVSVYQVSGEYAMIKAAAQRGWLDHDAIMLEQIYAIKRAGADLIASYFAKDVVKLL